MKLTELLKKITPLPWPNKPHSVAPTHIPGAEFDANIAYGRHAANVLPELVEACRTLLESTPINPEIAAPARIAQWREAQESLISSLTRAEEVKDA